MPEGAGEHHGRLPVEGDGFWLLIDKPAGITSHDVVDRVRRITGERHIGHAGTLDPMATGLLVLAVGSARKRLTEGLEGDKTYLATARFGLVSPTGDVDAGWTVEVTAPVLDRTRVERALANLAGQSSQVPPMVSAIKRQGHALYKLARRGWWLARESRDARIDAIRLHEYDAGAGTVTFEVTGGGGLYVRSLVRDLGAALGVPAALTALRRLAVGRFRVEEAVILEAFEREWEG